MTLCLSLVIDPLIERPPVLTKESTPISPPASRTSIFHASCNLTSTFCWRETVSLLELEHFPYPSSSWLWLWATKLSDKCSSLMWSRFYSRCPFHCSLPPKRISLPSPRTQLSMSEFRLITTTSSMSRLSSPSSSRNCAHWSLARELTNNTQCISPTTLPRLEWTLSKLRDKINLLRLSCLLSETWVKTALSVDKVKHSSLFSRSWRSSSIQLWIQVARCCSQEHAGFTHNTAPLSSKKLNIFTLLWERLLITFRVTTSLSELMQHAHLLLYWSMRKP